MLDADLKREKQLQELKECMFANNVTAMYSYTTGISEAQNEMKDRADEYEKVEGKYLRAKEKQQAEYDTFVYRMNNPPDRPYDTNH